jgi:formylglycine-generating enzyme required for sulfatase activity
MRLQEAHRALFAGDSNRPVEKVTWYDAAQFCNLLSVTEGLNPVYKFASAQVSYPITSGTVTVDLTKNGYRLPTLAEWEYAQQGGSPVDTYTYSGSDNILEVAWCSRNAAGTTHPVGTLAPNKLGLYDMSGNVSEWRKTLRVRPRRNSDPRSIRISPRSFRSRDSNENSRCDRRAGMATQDLCRRWSDRHV